MIKIEKWFKHSPFKSLFALLGERYVTQQPELPLQPWLITQLSDPELAVRIPERPLFCGIFILFCFQKTWRLMRAQVAPSSSEGHVADDPSQQRTAIKCGISLVTVTISRHEFNRVCTDLASGELSLDDGVQALLHNAGAKSSAEVSQPEPAGTSSANPRVAIEGPAPASSAEGNDFITLPRAAFEEGIRELEAAQLTSVATKLKQAMVETASRNVQSARSQELDALVSDLSARLASASADLSICQKTQSTDLPEQLVHTETALQSYTTQLAHAQETLKQLAAEVRAPSPSLSLIFIRVSLYCSLSLSVTACVMCFLLLSLIACMPL